MIRRFPYCFLIAISLLGCLAIRVPAYGQAQQLPYNHRFYQKFDQVQYSTETRQHTALKPFLLDSTLLPRYEALMERGPGLSNNRFFQEHLIELKDSSSTFFADLLPDFQGGRDFARDGKNVWNAGMGAQIGGTHGHTFYYYIKGYLNRSAFPDYINQYVDSVGVIPGNGFGDKQAAYQTWSNLSAVLSYTPVKYLNISLSYDKNFIGDGYRSMLLSDFSNNYTSLKLTGKVGNVQYMSMWAYMIDPLAPKLPGDASNRSKWGAFQYLDWNVNNRLSLGFFQSILWANKTEEGTRGFDPSYLNPIIFLRPIESSTPDSPDKNHLGLNAKYKLSKKVSAYGQFLLSEFTAKEFFAGNGYIHNKWGAQLGIRGHDVLQVEDLNFLTEVNFARPYTYSHKDVVTSYGHFAQPLAHPLGANFVEWVGMLNYAYKRFDFSIHGSYANYGRDANSSINYGKNIFKSYRSFVRRYGNHIAQGIASDLIYADARISYVLNPKYNLRLEAAAIMRQETSSLGRMSSGLLSIGLRSSFQDLYRDY